MKRKVTMVMDEKELITVIKKSTCISEKDRIWKDHLFRNFQKGLTELLSKSSVNFNSMTFQLTDVLEFLNEHTNIKKCSTPLCKNWFIQKHGSQKSCSPLCNNKDRQKRFLKKQTN